jgi:hypothetical protein
MQLFKRTAFGRQTQRKAAPANIVAVSALDGALTVHVGDVVLRIERSEVARMAQRAGVTEAATRETITELRSLAASLAAR